MNAQYRKNLKAVMEKSKEYTDNIYALATNNIAGKDTSTNILAKTSDSGIWIGSDTGYWYYWNGTQYADGGVYLSTANVITHNGNQLLDENGIDLYPNVLKTNIPDNVYLVSETFDYINYKIKNKYVNPNNGNIIDLNGMNYVNKMPVDGVDKVSLTNVATGGNAGVAGYDANGDYVMKLNSTSYTPSSEVISIPNNIKYISIDYSNDNALTIVAYYNNKYLFDKFNLIIGKVFNYKLPKVTNNSRIRFNNGKQQPDTYGYSSYDFIRIKPNTQITLECVSTLNNAYGCAFYDDKFYYISGIPTTGSDNNTINMTTPNNAYYLRVTCLTTQASNVKVYTNDLSLYNNSSVYDVPKVKANKIVWIDDDCNPTGIEYVYSSAILKNVPVTLASIVSNLDSTLITRLKDIELKRIDIALHGFSHSTTIWNNNNTDDYTFSEDIVKGLRGLNEFINKDYLITPNGINNSTIQDVAKQYCKCLVSAWEGVNRASQPERQYDLGRYWLSNHTYEELQAFVDGLPVANTLIIFATHSSPAIWTWDSQLINDDLDYIKSSGYDFVSLSEAIKYFYGI